jgi:hypothetical protein
VYQISVPEQFTVNSSDNSCILQAQHKAAIDEQTQQVDNLISDGLNYLSKRSEANLFSPCRMRTEGQNCGTPWFECKTASLREITNSTFFIGITKGCAMDQAVRHRPLTAGARVQYQASRCRTCGGRSGSGTDFSPRT